MSLQFQACLIWDASNLAGQQRPTRRFRSTFADALTEIEPLAVFSENPTVKNRARELLAAHRPDWRDNWGFPID